jgi:hypothetical protein
MHHRERIDAALDRGIGLARLGAPAARAWKLIRLEMTWRLFLTR